MGFAEDIEAFASKTERKMDLAVRKIALELFSRVILQTPVDKGRARANWQVAIGTAPDGTLELEDKSGTATISAATATAAGLRAGDVIYLVNNLPYILRLEDGYSGQAPAGMVGLAVQEFQRIAEQVGFELVQI
ncbi:phage-related conserved hypothetical protein [Ruegeria sp. TM1040]|uniref:hypothetical protein n=1 Tax=Ruegeria sp. (strain TM1040) TaxID=292414 RepID=UPI000046267A|nr:hypothetical protein [Ruegeria sp. TM1040]ABF63543.1 phage-related conserved hypothetical protein [Ruegeria sp. TM1040]